MRVALKPMREKRNMTQMELAQKSGVAQSRISEIERGATETPTILVLFKLAQAHKCTVDDLIEQDSNERRGTA